MPQQIASTIENTFTGGLKTEFTGLNFPAHAATDTDNCIYTLLGNVMRRPGIDYEDNVVGIPINRANQAMSSFIWNNVGGSGEIRFYVLQMGGQLIFFDITTATETTSLSARKINSNIQMATFTPVGAPSPDSFECQFAEGNGYLFVFHPYLEPFYVTYDLSLGVFTGHPIGVKIRDFHGIVEPGVQDQYRPAVSSSQHTYNLMNQGWTSQPAWSATSTSLNTPTTGSKVFTVAAGIVGISSGQTIVVRSTDNVATIMGGTVTSYSGTTLTLNITDASSNGLPFNNGWIIAPTNLGLISTWVASQGNYPSNADVWWRFKNTSNVFDPTTTQPNITLNAGPASKGFYILDAFYQARGSATGIAGLDAAGPNTINRPKTGTWFQGRVWYTGVEAPAIDMGSGVFYSWTETIYFSQVVETVVQFGRCYQENDPTAEEFFDELPTDGGVINIQGSGSIHKLFPIQNGLLVFAANGIWFITGSQGIGFSANDYTVTKISSIRSISSTSYVDVNGFPIFWNDDGIYAVSPAQQGGGLVVDNLCYGTILTFFSQIPAVCKRYVRGDYDPLSFVLSWAYRDTPESSVTNRYEFNKILNYNTANKAFYPHSFSSSTKIHDIKYVIPPKAGAGYPDAKFKYVSTTPGDGIWSLTFSELKDTTHWLDYYTVDSVGVDYTSYFVTGYRLTGKGLVKFSPMYFKFFSNSEVPTGYTIQGIWDYANDPNSGKYSTVQRVINALTRFGYLIRRHKLRGSGTSLQLKISSITGMPFNIVGWTSMEIQNGSM